MLFDTPQQDTLRDILTWRRDVRHFKTDPVPKDVLERLRKAMELAPSVGNARPWRIVRVKSPDLRQNIRDNFEQANEKASLLYENEQKADYSKLKLAGLDKAPEQFAVFTEIETRAMVLVAKPCRKHCANQPQWPFTRYGLQHGLKI